MVRVTNSLKWFGKVREGLRVRVINSLKWFRKVREGLRVRECLRLYISEVLFFNTCQYLRLVKILGKGLLCIQ